MKHSIPWLLLMTALQFGTLTSCARDRGAVAPTEPSSGALRSLAFTRSEPEDGSLTVVDVPGGTSQTALAVNDHGVIVGRYLAADGKTTLGYIRSPDGQFTTVQFPNAVFTVAAGVNDRGDVVGHYSLPSDIVPGKAAIRHGYLLSGGVYTSFDPPGSIRTNVLGINNDGDIVGRYNTAASTRQNGFVSRAGSFVAAVNFPGAIETNLWAINSRGDIVGAYVAPDGSNHIFMLRDGHFDAIALPVGNVPTDKGGINDRGDIAGFFCDAAPPAPCASGTGLSGVHAFLYGHGAFRQFDVPDAKQTVFFGINARGTLVGDYEDVNGAFHGFSLARGVHQLDATPASIVWNAIARDYVSGLTTKPNQQAVFRAFAYLSLAQYRAILAARHDDMSDDDGRDRGTASDAGRGTVQGAVAGASAAVLSYAFPADAALFDRDVDEVANSAEPNSASFARGVVIGRAVGSAVIAFAKTDRFDAVWTGTVPNGPCNWSGTNPVLPLLGQMRPFFLSSGSQFRPPAPPACDTPEFAAALAEVRHLSDTRTPEQLAIAQYWAGTTGSLVAGLWNEKITDLLTKHRSGERDAARALAVTNMAAMDAFIACHDGKYTYWFIRPFQADPAITTPIGRPNHPSYPSNHACVSGTIAYVLGGLLPSEAEQLAAQADQAAESRLYAGIHYRFDKDAGLEIARQVSAVALRSDLNGILPLATWK